MPMGPLRLIDEIGIDITVDIAATLEKAYGARDRAPEILQKMYAAKLFGRKTGAGFYKYEGKQQTPNEQLQEWRTESGEKFGLESITNRLVYLMVNEAARCLEEKVVATPEDADYGMVLGTGFGVPRRAARFESVGLKKVVTDMDGIIPAPARSSRHICFNMPRMELHSTKAGDHEIIARSPGKTDLGRNLGQARSGACHRHVENVGRQSGRPGTRGKLARSAR